MPISRINNDEDTLTKIPNLVIISNIVIIIAIIVICVFSFLIHLDDNYKVTIYAYQPFEQKDTLSIDVFCSIPFNMINLIDTTQIYSKSNKKLPISLQKIYYNSSINKYIFYYKIDKINKSILSNEEVEAYFLYKQQRSWGNVIFSRL